MSLNQTNLPAQSSPLVDRERVVEEIVELARLESPRVITLTGPGGIGKTRVALEAATELVAEFDDGVWFVDLAPVRDPELVAPSISSAVAAKTELTDHL